MHYRQRAGYGLLTVNGVKTLGGEEKVWQLPGLVMTAAGKHYLLLVLNDMALLGFGLDTAVAIAKLCARRWPGSPEPMRANKPSLILARCWR